MRVTATSSASNERKSRPNHRGQLYHGAQGTWVPHPGSPAAQAVEGLISTRGILPKQREVGQHCHDELPVALKCADHFLAIGFLRLDDHHGRFCFSILEPSVLWNFQRKGFANDDIAFDAENAARPAATSALVAARPTMNWSFGKGGDGPSKTQDRKKGGNESVHFASPAALVEPRRRRWLHRVERRCDIAMRESRPRQRRLRECRST